LIDLTKFQALFFDLDGTLLDSWPGVYDAYVQGCQYFQPGADISHIAALRNDGREYKKAIQYVFKMDCYNEQYGDQVARFYLEKLSQNAILFHGASEILAYLNSINKIWGIVTTKEKKFVREVMKIFPLLNTENLICSDDVSNKKPDPEGLLKIITKTGLIPNKQILYVGDLESDVNAARAAEISSICALYGYVSPREALLTWRADYYINTLYELLSR